jgi:hypothetical protein
MHSKDETPRKADPSRYQLPRASGKNRPPSPAAPARSAPSPSMPSSDLLSTGLKSCQDWAGMCLRTMTACLDLTADPTNTRHVAALQDCADMCETTARFIARRSPHLSLLCRACADLCTLCARECDAIHGDTCAVECAQACRLCAETCLSLTVHAGEG